MSDLDHDELRDQIAETIHCRICEHSREDCIENLGKCERATDSTMPRSSTALDEGNVLARLLSGALDDVIRTLRELAEKAAGEPIPFDDLDLYAEMVDGALDAAAVNALPDLLDALEKAEGHRDSLAATLIEVQREKLALERAIERVRALHVRTDEWCGHHEDTLCGCFEACCYECELLYPCPTIQALDGGE